VIHSREEKYIRVKSEHQSVLIHYDQLLLCTGTQYTTNIGLAPPTKGVVTINNSVQAKNVTSWVNSHTKGESHCMKCCSTSIPTHHRDSASLWQ